MLFGHGQSLEPPPQEKVRSRLLPGDIFLQFLRGYGAVAGNCRRFRRQPKFRLPGDLKKRISQAAENAGTSSHAFILGAIAQSVEAAERRSNLHETAEHRYAMIAETGKTMPWTEMRTYLSNRVSGKKASRPRPKKLAR